MAPEQFKTDLRQYADLRTILDSVERGALHYYLDAPSQAERNKRFKYLKTKLKPIHDYMIGPHCKPPLYDCGGFCSDLPCITQY